MSDATQPEDSINTAANPEEPYPYIETIVTEFEYNADGQISKETVTKIHGL